MIELVGVNLAAISEYTTMAKMTIRDLTFMLAGALMGTAVALFMQSPPATAADLQIEFDAYRTCMQSAGKTRCQMTPADFVRYYEIKRILDGE